MENHYERNIPLGCTLDEYRQGYVSEKLRKRRNGLCWVCYGFCALGLLEIGLGPWMILDALGGAAMVAVYHRFNKRWMMLAIAIYAAIFLQTLLFPTLLIAFTERAIREEYKVMLTIQNARKQTADTL